MAKSRLRGGKKAHNKRVKNRNQNISDSQKYVQKLWQKEFENRMEEIKTQMEAQSGETETNQTVDEQTVDIKI